jgi:hypothetical protein
MQAETPVFLQQHGFFKQRRDAVKRHPAAVFFIRGKRQPQQHAVSIVYFPRKRRLMN